MLAAVLGIGQILSWGTLCFGFPLIALGMEAELDWSKSEIYLGVTISMVMTAVFSFPVGLRIDRGQGRWILTGASLLILPVLSWWAVTSNLVAFYVISAFSGVLQATLLYEPAFAVLARRVGASQARAGITQITLWGGFASTVSVPLVAALIAWSDWRTTLIILGVINALYAIVYFVSIHPDRDVEQATDNTMRQTHAARDRQIVQQNLRRSAFWMLLLSLTFYAGNFSGLAYHMYPLLESKGLSATDVVIIMALIGPAQVLGRILVTWLAADRSLSQIGVVLACLFPIVFMFFYPAQVNFWVMAALCVTYGLVNGTFTIVRSLMVPELLSPHAYGALNGIITVSGTLARAAVPLAAAWVWSWQMSYQPVVLLLTGLSVLMMVTFCLAVWQARRSPYMD